MRILKFLLPLICILMWADGALAQNLLQNGTFSASGANWITSCSSIEATYFETTYGGTVGTNRVAEVDDESCFHQDICVLPGATYTFAMQASRRTSGSPNPLTTHINIIGLDALGATVATYVNMDFTRTNTVFALTAVTGIPTIAVPAGSGVIRLRVTLTDNTSGYSTLGMIVDNLSLTFATPPSVVAAATACQNHAASFSVSGVSAGADVFYNWTFGGSATPATSTSATPSVTWSTAGATAATVQLGNGTCWVDTISYAVTVNPSSSTTLFDTICFNSPITFNGSVISTSGTYLDTLSTISGCDSFITLNLVVKPQPAAPSITGDTFYCQGEPFVPFSVTGTGILWYTTPTGGVGSPAAPVVPTGTPGVYHYYASQVVNGCESARDSIRVTVNLTPVAPTASGATYCQYTATVPLTATGTNLLWYTTPTGGTGSPTAPTPSSAVAGVFTWYVSQTNNTCEGPRATANVTIFAKPPVPVITNTPGTYCPGQPFNNWTIVLGSNILWYTAATGGVGSATAPVVNTSVPGTYTFWASQTVNGCEGDRSSVTVVVNGIVTANFTYNIRYGCHGDTVSFNNLSTGGVSYSWNFGDGTSSTAFSPTHIYPVQNTYIVKLFTHSYTCVDSSVQSIDLNHKDSSGFTISSPLICEGSSTTFTNGSLPVVASYVWLFGDGGTSTVMNPAHTYTASGIYTVALIVTDFVPCKDTSYQVVTVDSSGGIGLRVTDTLLCRGTYVTMTTDFLDIGTDVLVWNFGNGDSAKDVNPVVYAYQEPGVYTLTTTSRFRACPTLTTSRILTVLPQPVINLGHDTTICAGSEAVLLKDWFNDGVAGMSWLWNTGETTSSIIVGSGGVFQATVRFGNCYASDSVTVINDCYANIPNVFSPNNDGLNDYFNPRDFFGRSLTSFKMDIYNRWGEIIFSTDKLTGKGWDGNYNGEPQMQGVYVYTVKATFGDGQKIEQRGNLTLLK